MKLWGIGGNDKRELGVGLGVMVKGNQMLWKFPFTDFNQISHDLIMASFAWGPSSSAPVYSDLMLNPSACYQEYIHIKFSIKLPFVLSAFIWYYDTIIRVVLAINIYVVLNQITSHISCTFPQRSSKGKWSKLSFIQWQWNTILYNWKWLVDPRYSHSNIIVHVCAQFCWSHSLCII